MDIQSIGLNTFVVVVVFARHEPNVTELNHDRSLGHILEHILDPTLNESREKDGVTKGVKLPHGWRFFHVYHLKILQRRGSPPNE